MTELNQLDSFCFKLLEDFMMKEVSIYRNKLGFHFDFDFKYMIFVKSVNDIQDILYGPGIRVRYNLFDMHLYSIPVHDYIDIKETLYEKNKVEIKKYIHEFIHPEYSLLVGDESNEVNIDMSKYYQIFVIKNQDKIIDYFDNKHNKN